MWVIIFFFGPASVNDKRNIFYCHRCFCDVFTIVNRRAIKAVSKSIFRTLYYVKWDIKNSPYSLVDKTILRTPWGGLAKTLRWSFEGMPLWSGYTRYSAQLLNGGVVSRSNANSDISLQPLERKVLWVFERSDKTINTLNDLREEH